MTSTFHTGRTSLLLNDAAVFLDLDSLIQLFKLWADRLGLPRRNQLRFDRWFPWFYCARDIARTRGTIVPGVVVIINDRVVNAVRYVLKWLLVLGKIKCDCIFGHNQLILTVRAWLLCVESSFLLVVIKLFWLVTHINWLFLSLLWNLNLLVIPWFCNWCYFCDT